MKHESMKKKLGDSITKVARRKIVSQVHGRYRSGECLT